MQYKTINDNLMYTEDLYYLKCNITALLKNNNYVKHTVMEL